MSFATGEANPHWRGGRWVTQRGYVYVRVAKDHPCERCGGRGYAPEHLLVFWQHHGRLPRAGFHIHHRDGDKANNVPNNLQEKRSDTHGRLHLTPERARELGRRGGQATARRRHGYSE